MWKVPPAASPISPTQVNQTSLVVHPSISSSRRCKELWLLSCKGHIISKLQLSGGKRNATVAGKAQFKTKVVTPRPIFTTIIFVLGNRKKFGYLKEFPALRRVTGETCFLFILSEGHPTRVLSDRRKLVHAYVAINHRIDSFEKKG